MVLTLKKPQSSKKVGWAQDTVDNEHLGRKKSKCKREKATKVFFSFFKGFLAAVLVMIIFPNFQVAVCTKNHTSSVRVPQSLKMTSVTIAVGMSNIRIPKRPHSHFVQS